MRDGLVDGEDIETRVRRIFPLIAGRGYMQSHAEDLDQLVRYAQARPMAPESYERQLSAVRGWVGVSDRLDQITLPTLVIHGDADPLVPYANGQYMAAHIHGAKLSTYPGVGHLLPIEAAERFNRDTMEFLS